MREGFTSFLWIALARGRLCYWQALLALSVPDSWKQFKTSFRGGGGTQRFLKRPLKHVSRTSCIRFPQSKLIQGKLCSFERHMKLYAAIIFLHLWRCIPHVCMGIFITVWLQNSLTEVFYLFSAVAQRLFTGSAGIDSKRRILRTYGILETIILPWKLLWF